MAPALADIAAFLDDALGAARFPDDTQGVITAMPRPVARIGLMLEPWPGMNAWVTTERLDALFVHRPFTLAAGQPPPGVGVVTSHLAFDAALTFGMNPRLALALGMTDARPFAEQHAVPRGMVGDIRAQSAEELLRRVTEVFGDAPGVRGPFGGTLSRIVIVNALSLDLMQQAAAAGAQCYLTGQLRASAEAGIRATGLPVLAIGHAAGERWGLRALAGLLRERWHELAVVIAPPVLLPPVSSTP